MCPQHKASKMKSTVREERPSIVWTRQTVKYIIFKSFMAFDIMFCGSVFRAIVGSEIVPPRQGKQKEEDFKGRKTIYCVDKN